MSEIEAIDTSGWRIDCVHVSLCELHHRKSVINFSESSYPQSVNSKQMDSYELMIKFLLSSFSIMASLYTNVRRMCIIGNKYMNSFLLRRDMTRRRKNGELVECETSFVRLTRRQSVANQNASSPTLISTSGKSQLALLNENRSTSSTSIAMDMLLFNLALSDLLIVIFCSWIHMLHSVDQDWQTSTFFCKFSAFSQRK